METNGIVLDALGDADSAAHLRVAEVAAPARSASWPRVCRSAGPPSRSTCASSRTQGSSATPRTAHGASTGSSRTGSTQMRAYFDGFWSRGARALRRRGTKGDRMSTTVTTEAIRKTVLVDFAPAEAFELFTTRVSSWWPTETHSYAATRSRTSSSSRESAALLYEVTDGGTAEWARITAWEPPHRLALEWLIGQGLRHRDRGALLAGGAGHRASSSSIAAGSASPTRPLSSRATTAAGTSCSRPSSRRRRRRPETSAAARPTAPLRWQARSTEARRAPSRRGGALAARAPAARRRRRDTPPCRRSRSRVARARVRSARAARPSRRSRPCAGRRSPAWCDRRRW